MFSVPFYPAILCDKKLASQQFCLSNIDGKCMHFFELAKSVRKGHGFCVKHNVHCTIARARRRPHFMQLAPDCDPFSEQRGNRRLVPPQDHDSFYATFGQDGRGSALEQLTKWQPEAWTLEQVGGFHKYRNPDNDKTWSEHFISLAQQICDVDCPDELLYSDVKVLRLRASNMHKDIERVRCHCKHEIYCTHYITLRFMICIYKHYIHYIF